jgi:hypothetical protein
LIGLPAQEFKGPRPIQVERTITMPVAMLMSLSWLRAVCNWSRVVRRAFNSVPRAMAVAIIGITTHIHRFHEVGEGALDDGVLEAATVAATAEHDEG